MSLRRWMMVWYGIGRDVGGPWMGIRNVSAGIGRCIRSGGRWPSPRERSTQADA